MKAPWGLVEGSVVLQEASAECQLRFAPGEPFFAGHFPGHPLVPGVVLVEALVRLAQGWSQSAAPLSTLLEAKFSSEVRPDDLVSCRVQKNNDGFAGEMRLGDRVALKAKFRL